MDDEGFTRLPEHVQFLCLSKLDWTSLARSATVCKLWRSMASAVNAQPRWESILIKRPISTDENMLDTLAPLMFAARPDLCLVYTSEQTKTSLTNLTSAIRKVLPWCCTIAGGATAGVIGSHAGVAEEVESGSYSHVSISLLHLPPNSSLALCREGKVLHSQPGVVPQLAGTWIVLAAAESPDDVIKTVLRKYPESTFTGGGVSHVMLSIGSGVSGVGGASDSSSKGCILQGSGVLGIGIMGPAAVSAVAAVQGLERVSQLYKVSRITSPLERGLETRQRYTVVDKVLAMDTVDSAGEEMDIMTMIAALPDNTEVTIAIVHIDEETGEHSLEAVRRTGVSGGSLFLPGTVPPGTIITFCVIDQQRSRSDMTACAGWLKSQLKGTCAPISDPAMTSASSWVGPLYPVTGVVSCICVARGRDFYQGEIDVETKVMREAFGPKAQLVGFFGNGELGPQPYGEHGWMDTSAAGQVQERTFTSVMTAIRLLPPGHL